MKLGLRTFLILASYSLLLVLLVGCVFYFSQDFLYLFSRINWWIISALVFLHIPAIALWGLAFYFLCSAHQLHLRWQEWAGLSFIANFLNHLLPYRPGMAFRYLYLHQRYQMKASQYIYIMLIYLLLTLFVGAIFLTIGLITSNLFKPFNHILFIALGIIGGTLCLGLLLVFLNATLNHFLRTTNHAVLNYFYKAITALETLRYYPKQGLGMLASFTVANLLMALAFYLIFYALHTPIPFMACIFLVGVTSLAMIFPITPGNIGLLETLFGSLTHLFYDDFTLGFGVMALFRASQWIPSVILGTGFSFILIGSLRPSLSLTNLKAKNNVD